MLVSYIFPSTYEWCNVAMFAMLHDNSYNYMIVVTVLKNAASFDNIIIVNSA
jgi:hypothetical protein